MKIRKGDMVKVMTGKDKGKTGHVIDVLRGQDRVRIEGVSMYKRHLKAGRSQKTPEGGILEMVGTIHASNVMLIESGASRPTRIGWKMDGDKKVRVGRGKSAGVVLDTK